MSRYPQDQRCQGEPDPLPIREDERDMPTQIPPDDDDPINNPDETEDIQDTPAGIHDDPTQLRGEEDSGPLHSRRDVPPQRDDQPLKQINEPKGKRSDNYSRADFDHADQIQPGQDLTTDDASLASTDDQQAEGPHEGKPHRPPEFDTQNRALVVGGEAPGADSLQLQTGHPIGSSSGMQNTKSDELKRHHLKRNI